MSSQSRQFLLELKIPNRDLLSSIESLYSFIDATIYAFKTTCLIPPTVFQYPLNNTQLDRLVDTLSKASLEQAANFVSELIDTNRESTGGLIGFSSTTGGFTYLQTNTADESLSLTLQTSSAADMSEATKQDNAFFSVLKTHLSPIKVTGVIIHKPKQTQNQPMSVSRVHYPVEGMFNVSSL